MSRRVHFMTPVSNNKRSSSSNTGTRINIVVSNNKPTVRILLRLTEMQHSVRGERMVTKLRRLAFPVVLVQMVPSPLTRVMVQRLVVPWIRRRRIIQPGLIEEELIEQSKV